MVLEQSRVTPVAVIGMGCRLPGGIHTPELLWEALLRGDDLITEIPADRWDVDEYYDPEPGVPGRSVCKTGAFLDDVGDFDPEFFGITDKKGPGSEWILSTAYSWQPPGRRWSTAVSAETRWPTCGPECSWDSMHGDYQFVHADAQAIAGPYGFTGTNFAWCPGGSRTPRRSRARQTVDPRARRA